MVYEYELMPVIESALNKDYQIEREVPMIDKFIDILAISKGPDEKELVAIEAKVKNWKRAVQQAITYRLCADKVYIAIWHEFRHRVDLHILDDFGIGLMEVNGTIRIIKEAMLVESTHSTIRETIFEHIAERLKNDRTC